MNRFLCCLICAVILSATSAVAQEGMLTYSTGTGPMDAALVIANQQHFLPKGLLLKTKIFKTGGKAFDGFLEGKSDFTTASVISVVLGDFDIANCRYVATLSRTDNLLKILVKKSSNYDSPADLRGKTIGTVKGTTAHFFLCRLLELNGVSCTEVDIQFYKKKQLADAIATGKVDAICQHGLPIEEAKKKLNGDWKIFQDDTVIRKSLGIVFPTKFVNDAPKTVSDIIDGAIKASKYIKTNLPEAVEIMAKARGYTIEAMTQAMRDEIMYDVSLQQSLLLELETMEQWAIDNKLVKRTTPRDYLKLIDYRFLEKLAFNAVTIVR